MRQPSTPEKQTSAKPPKLLDQVAAKIRLKHYRHRTKYRMCTGLNAIPSFMASVTPRIIMSTHRFRIP